MTNKSPIALFVFNRPEHTRKTIKALAANRGANNHDLIVFCDGPKYERDLDLVQEVQEIAHSAEGFRSVTVRTSEKNKGLAPSIIAGISDVLEANETVIVVEDDLVSSPGFLEWMQSGLDRYANEDRVISLHGYTYPIDNLPCSFFIRGADCWGWATWKRGWALFEPDGQKLMDEIKTRGLEYEFEFGATYPYLRMLQDQIEGKNSSWAIRWYASAFLAEKLTLYPGVSFIKNIGFDGSGTHSSAADTSFDIAQLSTISPPFPERAEESPTGRLAFKIYFRKNLSTRLKIRHLIRRFRFKKIDL